MNVVATGRCCITSKDMSPRLSKLLGFYCLKKFSQGSSYFYYSAKPAGGSHTLLFGGLLKHFFRLFFFFKGLSSC